MSILFTKQLAGLPNPEAGKAPGIKYRNRNCIRKRRAANSKPVLWKRKFLRPEDMNLFFRKPGMRGGKFR